MSYTPEQREELFTKIFSAIENGDSLRKALAAVKLSSKTFYEWLEDEGNEDKVKQYARACEERAEALLDEMIDIVDDVRFDYEDVIQLNEGGDETVVDKKPNYELIQRSRLRYDARKWLVSKLNPKKYGDKVQVAGDPDNPINVKFDITKVYREDQ